MIRIDFFQPRMKTLLRAALALGSFAIVLGLVAIVARPGDVDHEPQWKNSPAPPKDPLVTRFLGGQADPRELFPATAESQRARLFDALKAFYEGRGYATAWVEGRRARSSALELIGALEAAGRHGLDPADYRSEELAAANAAITAERFPMPGDLIGLDVRLTAAFLLYADHLARGRTEPAGATGPWRFELAPIDRIAVIARALDEHRVAAALDELAPGGEPYQGLLALHARYGALVEAGGWPRVPEGPTIELGETADAERLRTLASRLRAEGDLGDAEAGALEARWQDEVPGFDTTLSAAVARFQSRHGLSPDGKVGPATLAALNVPAHERRRQIELNLERWRWLAPAAGFPERYVYVNVPEYRLRGYDGGNAVIDMKVVVGKEDWQTPIFAEAIRYLVVNPYWNVPDAILAEEVIPAIRKDPGYLAREDMEVVAVRADAPDPSAIDWSKASPGNFPYRVRQRPGPRNALGQIKFIFPNSFDVYLHDTPARAAFGRERRALSHGCVRVERPLDLARFVLASEPRWTPEAIAEVIAGHQERQVPLSQPLPVYILYSTAFLGADGAANFREDVYGHDRALAAALASGARPDAPAQDDQRTWKPRVST